MMNIVVNNEATALRPGATVSHLLEQLEIDSQRVAIEVNLELIPREHHQHHELVDGDQVEVVTLVGGG